MCKAIRTNFRPCKQGCIFSIIPPPRGGGYENGKNSMCGTRMRFRGRRPRSFKTFRCGKKCMIYAKGWEVLKLSFVAQIWSYKAKCWRARRALNATYLILFLILVPQMSITKNYHIYELKYLPQNKKCGILFLRLLKKIYLKLETIYNLCSFHGHWGLRKKK